MRKALFFLSILVFVSCLSLDDENAGKRPTVEDTLVCTFDGGQYKPVSDMDGERFLTVELNETEDSLVIEAGFFPYAPRIKYSSRDDFSFQLAIALPVSELKKKEVSWRYIPFYECGKYGRAMIVKGGECYPDSHLWFIVNSYEKKHINADFALSDGMIQVSGGMLDYDVSEHSSKVWHLFD